MMYFTRNERLLVFFHDEGSLEETSLNLWKVLVDLDDDEKELDDLITTTLAKLGLIDEEEYQELLDTVLIEFSNMIDATCIDMLFHHDDDDEDDFDDEDDT